MSNEARMDERVEEMPYPEDTGRTHYEGCYRHRRHHNCAVAKVDALLDRLQAAEKRVEALEGALKPFANFACDPPCEGCHNCAAREALREGETDR